jgi:hypothetical protein
VKHSSPIPALYFDKRLDGWSDLEDRRVEAERLLTAWSWKSGLAKNFPLIACLMGGTGTGKSTLFNSLARRKISEVGAKRPCTLKAVVLAPEFAVTQISLCPFLDVQPLGNAEMVSETGNEIANIVLVDAPDFDSIEAPNRLMAENLFVISDLLMFVTSQEKYADLTAHQMAERARRWGKASIFIMNKVTSDSAFHDFRSALGDAGHECDPIRVERREPAPSLLPDLPNRPEFMDLLHREDRGREALRKDELDRLRKQTADRLGDLGKAVEAQKQRMRGFELKLHAALLDVTAEMQRQLDAILSENIESRVRERLEKLLRKYDVLFVPRMMVRNTLRTAFASLWQLVTGSPQLLSPGEGEREVRTEDLETTRSAVNLKPVETAVARLNFKIAELLASEPSLDDLRQVAREDVKRFGAADVQAEYDLAFPGVEHLLEEEFTHFRKGLSFQDELKLYGSYTLWALLLITAEIVVGGGFTLLDALLNTVIVPFIPKWLLNLKVLDVLREIGRRVDEKHRRALNAIVEKQAELYVTAFRSLLPSEETMENLLTVRQSLSLNKN